MCAASVPQVQSWCIDVTKKDVFAVVALATLATAGQLDDDDISDIRTDAEYGKKFQESQVYANRVRPSLDTDKAAVHVDMIMQGLTMAAASPAGVVLTGWCSWCRCILTMQASCPVSFASLPLLKNCINIHVASEGTQNLLVLRSAHILGLLIAYQRAQQPVRCINVQIPRVHCVLKESVQRPRMAAQMHMHSQDILHCCAWDVW